MCKSYFMEHQFILLFYVSELQWQSVLLLLLPAWQTAMTYCMKKKCHYLCARYSYDLVVISIAMLFDLQCNIAVQTIAKKLLFVLLGLYIYISVHLFWTHFDLGWIITMKYPGKTELPYSTLLWLLAGIKIGKA